MTPELRSLLISAFKAALESEHGIAISSNDISRLTSSLRALRNELLPNWPELKPIIFRAPPPDITNEIWLIVDADYKRPFGRGRVIAPPSMQALSTEFINGTSPINSSRDPEDNNPDLL